MGAFIDLTGQIFGDLSVIKRNGVLHKQVAWECECKCGRKKTIVSSSLRAGYTTSCGCLGEKYKLRSSKNPMWTGFGEINGAFWSTIRSSARSRKIDFDITIEYVWNLFIEQNRECSLTGLVLYMPQHNHYDKTASLDRIDSSKGYIEGNVQWVHNVVNKMKSNMSDKELKYWCSLIFNKDKNERN